MVWSFFCVNGRDRSVRHKKRLFGDLWLVDGTDFDKLGVVSAEVAPEAEQLLACRERKTFRQEPEGAIPWTGQHSKGGLKRAASTGGLNSRKIERGTGR